MKQKGSKRISIIHNSIFIKVTLALFFLTVLLIVENKKVLESSEKPAKREANTGTITIMPESDPSPTPTMSNSIFLIPSPQKQKSNEQWGIAKQVGEHTYTIRVGMDEKMATPQEIFQALNEYRKVQGRNSLVWDSNLASYAQSRADYFLKENKLDSHAGFNAFLSSEEGFNTLGFLSVGENSSIGYRLTGVHLIEWVYASDQPHNENQLNTTWTHVGVGVAGTATDIIFGANKK